MGVYLRANRADACRGEAGPDKAPSGCSTSEPVRSYKAFAAPGGSCQFCASSFNFGMYDWLSREHNEDAD